MALANLCKNLARAMRFILIKNIIARGIFSTDLEQCTLKVKNSLEMYLYISIPIGFPLSNLVGKKRGLQTIEESPNFWKMTNGTVIRIISEKIILIQLRAGNFYQKFWAGWRVVSKR